MTKASHPDLMEALANAGRAAITPALPQRDPMRVTESLTMIAGPARLMRDTFANATRFIGTHGGKVATNREFDNADAPRLGWLTN